MQNLNIIAPLCSKFWYWKNSEKDNVDTDLNNYYSSANESDTENEKISIRGEDSKAKIYKICNEKCILFFYVCIVEDTGYH